MNGQDSFTPKLSQREYLDRLKNAGYRGNQALGIMVDSGFDGESVRADLLSDYEVEREQFLKQQEEIRKQIEAEKKRREQLEAEKEERDQFFEDQKKKGTGSELSGGTVLSGEETQATPEGFELGQQLAQISEQYDIDDPTSPVSTSAPDILQNAMLRGDDNVVALSESINNDKSVANIVEVAELNTAYQRAMRAEDFDAAESLRGDMADLGFDIPRYASGAFTVEDHLKQVRQKLSNNRSDLIDQRNQINASLGLPSSLNPQSQVDFNYMLTEAYERNDLNWKNSEIGRYYNRIDKEAAKVKDKYDAFYGGSGIENIPYLGSVWRLAADVFKGRTQDFVFGLTTGSVGALKMANDAVMEIDRALGFDNEDNVIDEVLTTMQLGSNVVSDIFSKANQLELQSRGVSKDVAGMGFVELIKGVFAGEVPADQFRKAFAMRGGEAFGNARGYMRMIGATKAPLMKAKAAQSTALKAGMGAPTAAQAASIRSANSALRAAKSRHGYNLGFLGGTSGGGFYNTLEGRADMTFAEKASMSIMIGSAEALLSDVFSAADVALATGRKSLFQQSVNNLKKQSKERLAELTKGRAVKEGFKIAGKQGGGEFLEEFTIGLLQEALPHLDDMAFGRTPKDINWYNVLDAGIAGLIGAGPTSAMSGYASFQAHHSVLKERNDIRRKMSENQAKMDADPNSSFRQDLESEQQMLAARLMQVDDESMRAFDKMSEGSRRRLLKIHRDMAYTEAKLNDKNLSKEERSFLEKRYETLFAAKQRVENQAGAEPDFTRTDESVSAQDASEKETEVESQPLNQLERNNADLPSEADNAPLDQKEEAQQLSLFDESEQNEKAPEKKPEQKTKKPTEEKPTEEKPIEEKTPEDKAPDLEDLDLGKGTLIDIMDVGKVGEGEGRISLGAAIRANRLNNSLGKKLSKDGYKFRVYSREKFTELYDADGYGAVDHVNKVISIPVDANASEVTEEFVHAAFRDVIGKDAKGRRAIYNHLASQAKGSGQLAQLIRSEIVFARNNPTYKKQGEAAIQEEAIMGVLLKYVENPAIFESKPGFLNKFRTLVSSMVAKFSGTKDVAINNNEEFLEFARRVKASTEGRDVDTSQQVDIQEVTAKDIMADQSLSQEEKNRRVEELTDQMLADAEGIRTSDEDVLSQDDTQDIDSVRMSFGRRKSEFTYLKDTEVFYTEDPYTDIGEPIPVFERSRGKKIKVNDYFHFRNWYNHMTSNGRRPARVTQMYFIKDGKKYTIKPPKPKTDREGNVVRIDGAENARLSSIRKSQERQSRQARDRKAQEKKVFDLGRDAEILKRAGIDPLQGMALVPGFNREEYNQIEDADEKFSYLSKFRKEMLFNRTAEEQDEVLEIAYENLQLLKESGLSLEEVSKAEAVEILNMSGRTPSFMAQGGDILNNGNVRLSSGRRGQRAMTDEQSESYKSSVREAFPNMSDEELFFTDQELKDINGAQSILIGYDRSGKQVGTGILTQVEQFFGGRVVSSHRNPAMRDRVFRKMTALIEKDKKSKNPKGFIVVAIGAIDIPSLPGNPAVFSKIVLDYVNEVNGQERIDRINEILKGMSKDDLTRIYNASRSRRTEGAMAFNLMSKGLDPSKLKDGISSEQEAEDFASIISDVKNFDDFATSFNDRGRIARRIIKENILRASGTGSGVLVQEYIQNNFSDLSLKDVPGASVVSMMKVPYGEGNPFSISDTKSDAFPDAIVSNSAERMKFLAKPVPVESAYSKAKYTDKTTKTQKKVFTKKAQAEGKIVKFAKKQLGYGTEAEITLGDDVVTDHSLSSGRRNQNSFIQQEESGFQRWKNKWIRRLQDKYVDIFNIQADIERQRGPIRKSQDFQMAEELMYGKAAEDLAKLDKRVDAITAAMKKAGIKVDEVSEYLYALHAKERNALILERSNGAVENGSGMPDSEADAIIQAANKQALDPIVKMIREIQKDTRETMVNYGLETRETVNAFENMFDNYVPLSGVSMDETVKSPYPTGGAGMNVFGPTTKRAKGRESKAVNILAQVVAQNASVHIKARTNESLQALHNLIKENPNSRVWRILDSSSGIDSSSPNAVAVRIGGRQKFIYFNDPSYAQNLKGMGIPHSNAFVRALRAPAQWLRASFTTLNPEFVISNFSRDIQSALFNASAEAEIEGGMLNSAKTVKRIFKLIPQTLTTLTKNAVQRGGDPAIEKYFQEFKDDGGKTGWAYAKPLDQLASELELATDGKTKTQEILGKAKNFAEFIEGINDAFENSIRLASYIAARESGVSREKAAQLAKNITVNFNKQGEYGPTLNAVYLFFNASVQGTARLGRSLINLRPQKRPDGTDRNAFQRITSAQWMASGLGLFSSMLTMLGYAMSDEDEDGTPYWDKIPDYVKERNLVIMRPNGKDYFKIPMPYGFNVFANMGTAMTEAAYGGREADEAMMFLFNSFMASFSPVSFGQSDDLFKSVGKGAVPTVMKPFVDVMVNETYFGTPVTGENLPFGTQKPDSELSFRSPESVQDFFSWMNEATGGSEYKSGGLDFNPDKFWYMFEYYIGGAGQFVNRSLFKFPKQLKAKLFYDQDIQIQAGDVPLARILYGQPNKYFDMEKFKDNQQEFESLYKELKEGYTFDKERHKGIGSSTNKILRSTLKELKFLRSKKKDLRDLPYDERLLRTQKIRDRERQLIMRFNKYYEQARKN